MPREFTISPGVRSSVPVLIAIAGGSGSGKTFSAMRLAEGIQSVSGAKPFHIIDTEARRALHYSDQFNFRHVEFTPPYNAASYAAAIDACLADGAETIVIDQMSYEHEGQGGCLEMHEDEIQRLTRGDETARDKWNMAAWGLPKAQRRQLIAKITTSPCNFILLFRAKDKVKPVRGKGIQEIGWVPIGGEEYVFEMSAKFLLMPGSNGHPTWESDYPGEQMMIKIPGQFREIFSRHKQLTQDVGVELAKWARAGSLATKPPAVGVTVPEVLSAYATVTDNRFASTYKEAEAARRTLVGKMTEEEAATLKAAALEAHKRLKAA